VRYKPLKVKTDKKSVAFSIGVSQYLAIQKCNSMYQEVCVSTTLNYLAI